MHSEGIYLIHPEHVETYLADRKAVQLRWSRNVNTSALAASCNFGNSKGLGFDHVLIHPTESMWKWLFNHNENLNSETRAKLYVAITRAKYSAAFVISGKCSASHNYTLYEPSLNTADQMAAA